MVSTADAAGISLLRRKTGCVVVGVCVFVALFVGVVLLGVVALLVVVSLLVVLSLVVSQLGVMSLADTSVALAATSMAFPAPFIASEKRGQGRLSGEGEKDKGGAGRFDGVGKGDCDSEWMQRFEGVESDWEGEESSSLSCDAGTQSSCRGVIAGMAVDGALEGGLERR